MMVLVATIQVHAGANPLYVEGFLDLPFHPEGLLSVCVPIRVYSQNRVVAWTQVGQHIWCCVMCGKLAYGSNLVQGAWPPRKILNLGPPRWHLRVFRPSKCSENNTRLQYSGSALVAIQLSRKLLLVLNVSNPHLFQLCADSFTCGANLKLRQTNARAQAKVARARARVCRGLATPLVPIGSGGYVNLHVQQCHCWCQPWILHRYLCSFSLASRVLPVSPMTMLHDIHIGLCTPHP